MKYLSTYIYLSIYLSLYDAFTLSPRDSNIKIGTSKGDIFQLGEKIGERSMHASIFTATALIDYPPFLKKGATLAVKKMDLTIFSPGEAAHHSKLETECGRALGLNLGDYIKDFKTNQFYVPMKLIVGKTLSAVFNDLDLITTIDIVKVYKDIKKRLKTLHDAGFIHDDLHLGNIMLEEPTKSSFKKVWLIDFEMAKTLSGRTDLEKLILIKEDFNFLRSAMQGKVNTQAVKHNVKSLLLLKKILFDEVLADKKARDLELERKVKIKKEKEKEKEDERRRTNALFSGWIGNFHGMPWK